MTHGRTGVLEVLCSTDVLDSDRAPASAAGPTPNLALRFIARCEADRALSVTRVYSTGPDAIVSA